MGVGLRFCQYRKHVGVGEYTYMKQFKKISAHLLDFILTILAINLIILFFSSLWVWNNEIDPLAGGRLSQTRRRIFMRHFYLSIKFKSW